MANKTYKQKRQEEEYNKWKREQQQQLSDSEDLFGLKKNHTRHVNKTCSVCGSPQAWRSSDHGATWQCWAHAKEL